MNRIRASLLAAAGISCWIVLDTIQAAIDLFVLLRLLRAPVQRGPVLVGTAEPRLPHPQNI